MYKVKYLQPFDARAELGEQQEREDSSEGPGEAGALPHDQGFRSREEGGRGDQSGFFSVRLQTLQLKNSSLALSLSLSLSLSLYARLSPSLGLSRRVNTYHGWSHSIQHVIIWVRGPYLQLNGLVTAVKRASLSRRVLGLSVMMWVIVQNSHQKCHMWENICKISVTKTVI